MMNMPPDPKGAQYAPQEKTHDEAEIDTAVANDRDAALIKKLHRITHAFIAAVLAVSVLWGASVHIRFNEAIEVAQAVCQEIEAIPAETEAAD